MIRKHSITLHGHRTSFSLEDAFWLEIRAIASERKLPLASLLVEIDETRSPEANLSSAIRVFVLNHLKAARQTE